MVNNEQIPIVTHESFHRSYFRHGINTLNTSLSDSDLYVEVQHKCLWKRQVAPHRLDFYMVLLNTEGEGFHTFGIKEHYIRKNMLCFVGPNMITSWEAQTNHHQGYFCSFSEAFVTAGSDNKHFLQHLPFFQIDGNPVLQLSDDQAEYYLTLFKFMHEESINRTKHSTAILRNQLMVILNKAYAHQQTIQGEAQEATGAGLRLLKLFTGLYLRDFAAIRSGKSVSLKKVSEYADELGVSQNHLNDSIKAITGRSAGQLIKDQLTRQATMCLMHSNKSISEISYRLGFEDPSYFSRFYKAQSGKTPSEFRHAHHL